MTFISKIKKNLPFVYQQGKETFAHAAKRKYQIDEEKIKRFSDFDAAFIHLLIEEGFNLIKEEHYEKVVNQFRLFYQSSRITFEHINYFGINFPSEDNEKWSIAFEIVGGAFVVFLNYRGFELEGVSASH